MIVDILKSGILEASKELNSKELVYECFFWFGLPSHSLKIAGVDIFKNYDIPTGWDGVGEQHLSLLEKEGFLRKTSETIQDQDTLDKIVKYLICSGDQSSENS